MPSCRLPSAKSTQGWACTTPRTSLLAKAGGIEGQSPNARLRQTIALAELEFQRGNDARADELLRTAEKLAANRDDETGPWVCARESFSIVATSPRISSATRMRGNIFRRALRVGETHDLADVTPRALEGIALAAFYGGDMDLARRSYENALAVRIRRSGETHPKVSESLTALGSIAYTQARPDAAEKYWLRSLAVDQRILGPRHPDLAVTLNNLGRLDVERRNFVRAKERLANAVSIYAAQQSETHEGQIFAWTNLALADIGLGDVDAAEPLLERALRAAVATKHRLEGPILTDLAGLECSTDRASAGLARLDAARPIVAERYPDEAWRVALVDNVRAGCLAQLGQATEAEPLIASSVPVLIEKWPADSYYGHDAMQRAMRVYTMTGNRTRLAELARL